MISAEKLSIFKVCVFFATSIQYVVLRYYACLLDFTYMHYESNSFPFRIFSVSYVVTMDMMSIPQQPLSVQLSEWLPPARLSKRVAIMAIVDDNSLMSMMDALRKLLKMNYSIIRS